jgi:hypothetical protein
MYDDTLPPFWCRDGEDFDQAYARIVKKARMRTAGMPEDVLDELKRKLRAFGQDSETSSYNGTPCREWALDRNNGYGVVDLVYELDGVRNSYQQTAHRAAWCLHREDGRDLPSSVFVRHQCHNRLCYNVDHLLLGSHKDNMGDGGGTTGISCAVRRRSGNLRT